MKIKKTDLDSALERVDFTVRSSIRRRAEKMGWQKVVPTVGDLRTTFLDDYIDSLVVGLDKDESVEII